MKLALRSRPPTDAACFAGYIQSTWHSHSVSSRKRAHGTTTDDTDDVLRKTVFLVRHLLSVPDSALHGFHALVWLKAEVIQRYSDSDARVLGESSREIDRLFERLLARPPLTSADGSYRVYPAHYDCAAARRKLWQAWEEFECHRTAQVRGNFRPPQCFHARSERMLGLLNKHAQEEIRQTVWLAVGRQLPEELTDYVYQYTLMAEEVPELPNIREADDRLREGYHCQSR